MRGKRAKGIRRVVAQTFPPTRERSYLGKFGPHGGFVDRGDGKATPWTLAPGTFRHAYRTARKMLTRVRMPGSPPVNAGYFKARKLR